MFSQVSSELGKDIQEKLAHYNSQSKKELEHL
jgi:hypothetical protein